MIWRQFDVESSTPPGLPELPGVDLAAARALMDGNHALLLRAVQAFLRDYSAVPATVAGDLRPAEVARIAHNMKGAASYLCAADLAASAAALEQAAHAADAAALARRTPVFIAHMNLVLDSLGRFSASLRVAAPEDTAAGLSDSASDSASADPSEGLSDDSSGGAREQRRRAAALALLARITPLLGDGDYAAIALLEELGAILQDGPAAGRPAAIIGLFEELDTDGAGELLDALARELHAAGPA